MALFDTSGGLSGLLGDFGFGVPRNTGGLIGNDEMDAINKRALLSGGINAALTYLATPKNLNTGSALPYLGKAGLAGFNASQNTVDQALNMAYRNKMLAGKDDNLRTIKQDRFTITQEKQPDGSYKEIARSAEDAPKEIKEPTLPNLAQEYEYAVNKGYKGKFEDWKKLSIDARLAAEMPLREQQANYNYGSIPTPIKKPTFATMQDVSDTAKATGKTTDQVIQDFKAKNIEVRTK